MCHGSRVDGKPYEVIRTVHTAGALDWATVTALLEPRGYCPDQTDPANSIATAINSLPKYVVSNSLSQAGASWRGEHPDTARLVTGDVIAAVQALKDEPGDELQICPAPPEPPEPNHVARAS